MCAASALVIRALRRLPTAYWVMDLNPDQMIALGHVDPRSPFVRAFELLNRAILSEAGVVIALDRYMASRLRAKVMHCHASEIVEARRLGLRAANGDVDATVRAITQLADTPRSELSAMGARARAAAAADFSRARLLGQFADLLEHRLGLISPTAHAQAAE